MVIPTAVSMKIEQVNGSVKADKSFDTLYIPTFAGAQKVTARYQRRTQIQYTLLACLGLLAFYGDRNSHVRVAGLSCLFPGAGFLAVGGILGAIGLVLSLAFLPLSIFAWFGAGGLAFILANWIVPALIASAIVGDSVWEPAAPITVVLVMVLVAFMIISSRQRQASALNLRDSRNNLLMREDAAWRSRVTNQKQKTEPRELSRQELRLLQHFIQVAHQAADDWSNFTRIDQFQTSALRYQLYDLQYTFTLVQKFYMPNFQGYIKTAQERVIEKSTTKDVMNFWKWESLWGKFTLNWDPVVRDNIMVTGFILICLSLYEKLNGDDRYSKRRSLNFRITEGAQYRHDTDSIFEALMKNWESCAYCLFPCEPNWIYSACNLVGMEGALAYDSYKKTGRVAALLKDRYHRAFEEEFMNPDGSVVALRSAITGFPILGLGGVLGDVGGALFCSTAMPNLARRLWLISRESKIRTTTNGKYTIDNLVGPDNMDVGNYKAGRGFALAMYSKCAAEFGEEDLVHDLIAEVDNDLHPIVESPSGNGALTSSGLSMLGSGYLFRARIMKYGDWAELINSPVDVTAMAAPKLDSIPFPEVMVARCHAHDETGLDFVLRGPEESKPFTLGFKDLQLDTPYQLLLGEDGKWQEAVSGIQADVDGRAMVQVRVGERSEFRLRAMV